MKRCQVSRMDPDTVLVDKCVVFKRGKLVFLQVDDEFGKLTQQLWCGFRVPLSGGRKIGVSTKLVDEMCGSLGQSVVVYRKNRRRFGHGSYTTEERANHDNKREICSRNKRVNETR